MNLHVRIIAESLIENFGNVYDSEGKSQNRQGSCMFVPM
jgi:hypothetical protein